MAAGAAGRLIRCIFAGAVAVGDSEIERRPYHRLCGCALHDPRWCSKPPSACSHTIFYPFRRSSGTSLALMASLHASSTSSSPLSSSSESPVVIKGARPGPNQAKDWAAGAHEYRPECNKSPFDMNKHS